MKNNLNPEASRAHNHRNTRHTVMLIGGTALLMGAMAYSVLGFTGLLAAFVICCIGLLGIRNMSPQMVLKLYKARPLAESEMPELHSVVRKLAANADLPAVPQLYYVPSKMLNAFAVGNRNDAAIAITDGLLRAVNMRQLAGILAHETAHIMNGDLKVMGTADILNRITNFMSTLGLLGIPAVFGFGVNLPLIGLLLLIFAPTVGGLLQLGLSRAREYDADLDGATLTGDPEGLASALILLEEKQKGIWEGLFLPGSRVPQPSMLRTHPKTEDRIARLRAIKGDAPVPAAPHQEVIAQPGFMPPLRDPRIQWQRLGVYY
jgi:heat shock protein HtpX